MTCEFSDKVRGATRRIILEMFNKMGRNDKGKFRSMFGNEMFVQDAYFYRAYYYCKHAIDRRKEIVNKNKTNHHYSRSSDS